MITIDLPDIPELKKDPWGFAVTYHPDWTHSQDVADSDDLECLIHNECDDEKYNRLTEIYGTNREKWQEMSDEADNKIIQDAIENYYRLNQE